jgi:hypothetical protein
MVIGVRRPCTAHDRRALEEIFAETFLNEIVP